MDNPYYEKGLRLSNVFEKNSSDSEESTSDLNIQNSNIDEVLEIAVISEDVLGKSNDFHVEIKKSYMQESLSINESNSAPKNQNHEGN